MKETGMKLHGTKLIIVSAIALASAITFAESIESPTLTTFTAGTPAKASEVNDNFDALKTYGEAIDSNLTNLETEVSTLQASHTTLSETVSTQTTDINTLNVTATSLNTSVTTNTNSISALNTSVSNLSTDATNTAADVTALTAQINSQAETISALETKIEALEAASGGSSSDEFSIEVRGDGNLIGYTNRVLFNFDKPYILVKTTHGFATIRGVYDSTGYYLDGYDELTASAGRNGYVYYTDNACSQNPSRVVKSDDLPQLVFTKVANTIDTKNFIYQEGKGTYFIEAGTVFTKTSSETTMYSYDSYEDSCNSQTISENALITPVIPVTQNTHGLQSTYSTITIDGYSSPN
jgi:uncharacterized protein YoxC